MSIPLSEQISCVRRELGLRKNVYVRMVANKSMTQAWADYQLEAMTAVLATLEGIATTQGELWPEEVAHEAEHEA